MRHQPKTPCESTGTLKDLRDHANFFEVVRVTIIIHYILMHQLKTPEIFLFHLHAYLLEIFDQNFKKNIICERFFDQKLKL